MSDLDQEGTHFQGPAVLEHTTDDFGHYFLGWEEEVAVLIKVWFVFLRFSNQSPKKLIPNNWFVVLALCSEVFQMGDTNSEALEYVRIRACGSSRRCGKHDTVQIDCRVEEI